MINTVNSSSRPMSMMKARKILAASGIKLKLLSGPTEPIAGPTLARQVAIAPSEEIKSMPIAVTTMLPRIKQAK